MNYILKPESPLHFLPVELGKEQLMILDSLRFTLEVIDYTYSQLIHSLENVTLAKENKIHFKIFHYAWSIIDYSQRFQKLYKTLNHPKNSIIHNLSYVDIFRNAIQHVDLNLKKTNVKMLENGRPIYGTLKWVVSDKQKNEVYTAILVSGIFFTENITWKQHSQEANSALVSDVILETDTLNKKDENEINLCQLIRDVSEVTDILEKSLEDFFNSKKFQKLDWKKRKDILILMKNEKATD